MRLPDCEFQIPGETGEIWWPFDWKLQPITWRSLLPRNVAKWVALLDGRTIATPCGRALVRLRR